MVECPTLVEVVVVALHLKVKKALYGCCCLHLALELKIIFKMIFSQNVS